MKRNTTLLLSVPVALALASCGMTAQYSYQQYQDGIYSYGGTYVPRKEVTIYSVEDFEAMAAARIAEKQGAARDTVYVVLEDDRDSDIYLSFGLVPFLLWDSWYLPDPWEYRIWYNHYRWYDPWYYGYSWAFDPWYHHYWHDPWYYGHWYDPWYHGYWHHDPWHVGPRPPKPGLSPDGRRYFGERRFTQSPGRGERVPGTGSNRRNPGSVTRPAVGGGAYGSAGSTVLRPSSGGSAIGGGTAPSHNSGAAGGSSVRTRYSNSQSSPSINIGSGTRPSQTGGSIIGSGASPAPNRGSSVRSGGTSIRRNDSYRSSGSTTVRRNPSTPSSIRSGSTTRSRSSFSSPGSSSRPSSSYSSGFSGGSRSSGSFSGGSRPSGGGARRR
ncbi:MAG TPA: hypothetical protein IAC98_05880 [Candidatus Cryptobacteroides pullicola]|nr:hypothetical protein [Candidatus Cryptobacteroides pullicola]